MINIPRGFLAIPSTDSDGSYIPFFIKVRSEDIVWTGGNFNKYLNTITNNTLRNIKTINPSIYNIKVPSTQKILIDEDDNIYFIKNDTYYQYSIPSFKYHSVDMDNDNIDDNSKFIFGTINESQTPPDVKTIKIRLDNINYTWDCRINQDGFTIVNTFIPVCNYVINKINDVDNYYCYSVFDYIKSESYMDSLLLNNITLPIPFLPDSLNIQINKKSNVKEFTNTFTSSTFNRNTLNVNIDNTTHSFSVIDKINVELNGINKLSYSDSFAYILRNCGVYISISGYIPISEN